MRRHSLIATAALSSVLLCGFQSTQGCQPAPVAHIGPTGGQIAGAAVVIGAVVIGTVVLVEVHKGHHRLKGCVVSGPDGLALQTLKDGNTTTFALEGDMTRVKAGDLVQVKGNHIKKTTDSAGDAVFAVEKLRKDFGPCKPS